MNQHECSVGMGNNLHSVWGDLLHLRLSVMFGCVDLPVLLSVNFGHKDHFEQNYDITKI